MIKVYEIMDGVIHRIAPPPREELAGQCYGCGGTASKIVEKQEKHLWCGECEFTLQEAA